MKTQKTEEKSSSRSNLYLKNFQKKKNLIAVKLIQQGHRRTKVSKTGYQSSMRNEDILHIKQDK